VEKKLNSAIWFKGYGGFSNKNNLKSNLGKAKVVDFCRGREEDAFLISL